MTSRAKLTGFTLIEVLIAMSLFAVIGLACFGLFTSVTDGDKNAREQIEKLNKLQRAFLVMERDFTQLTQRRVRLDGNEPRKEFIYSHQGGFSDDSGIAFVKQGWRNPGLILARSDLQPVAYMLEDNKLLRTHFNFVDPIVGEEPKVRVLLEDITELKFEFFINKEWREQLENNQIPQAIAIMITSEQLGEIRRLFLLPNEPQSKKVPD